eukprot:7879681-Alexandrium_andersonii.AAC.1
MAGNAMQASQVGAVAAFVFACQRPLSSERCLSSFASCHAVARVKLACALRAVVSEVLGEEQGIGLNARH